MHLDKSTFMTCKWMEFEIIEKINGDKNINLTFVYYLFPEVCEH